MDTSTDDVKRVLKKASQALKANPRDSALHNMVAPLYEQLERYDEAVPHLAFLVSHAAHPDEVLYWRYIKALQRSGQAPKAQQVTEEGLRRHPGSVLLLRNRAINFLLLRDFEQARQIYAHLYALDPSDAHSAGMAGTMKLLVSDMKEGYEEYALRPHEDKMVTLLGAIPKWSGEPLKGKRIILWNEQGIGDVIMFLGMVGWIAGMDAKVTLAVVSKLGSVVQRSFPAMNVVSALSVSGMANAPYDYHLPLGDLLPFGLRQYVPAEHSPYLAVDAERASRLRASYLEYARERGRARLVGISWHTTNPYVGFTRNVSLAEWHPILSVPGVQFVSLQYGDHAEEVAECNQRVKDILYHDTAIDAFDDIDGLAAQMAAMDEIVTIDNATVHLAGAIGIPTTVLLSTMPDWRWGLAGSECRWYGSVKLERQEALLRWQPVIKRIRARMMDTVSGRP